MRTPDPTDELLRDWASRQEQDAKELRALTKRISEEARVSCFVSLPEVPAARRPSLSFLAWLCRLLKNLWDSITSGWRRRT